METLTRPIEWGAATVTRQGEAESGDRYTVASFDSGVLVAVIDGLGHGEEAAEAAELAARILENAPHESVITLMSRCHESLRSTRGVVMSLASFSTPDETMTWLGVGNVEGRLVRASPGMIQRDSRGGERRTRQQPVTVERRRDERRQFRSESLLLRAGVVGSHLPPLYGALLPLQPGDTLLLATDGVALPDVADVGPGEKPQALAERILSRHRRGTDDAAVVVARWVGPPAMNTPSPELLARYTATLSEYLHERGEAALQHAYELGRSALTEGLGVLEMAMIHHQAMERTLRSRDGNLPGAIEAAGQFLAESLSPFEMTHRGYREANAALQASEKRYRELFENANDIVFTTDLTGTLTSVNRAGENLTGYRRDEVSAMNFAALVAPEHLPIARRMLTQKLTGEAEDTRYEIDIVTRDGRRIPVEVHTSMLLQDGQPVGIQGIARDVTERRQAEQALRSLNERLEEEARRIAHALHDEAGQLLSSVHLALEEFAHELPPTARTGLHPVKELLDQIEDELRRLSHELRPTILDDLGLLPALEFLAGRVAKRSGLTVTVRGDTMERLAPSAETALYRSVQEALTNVVRHAQATRVHVEIRREEGAIHCSVRDDGAGFDLSTVLSRTGHGGLGLTGIRERASALGGTLAIRSAPGKGTELVIAIPLGK